MRNESVAVLDIRSYEVTFLIGSRGVNGTFVFLGSRSEKYEGYSSEGFFDVASFRSAVISAVTSVRQSYEGTIREICVGVPAAFTQVHTKGHTISFPSRRKISAQEIDALYESGLSEILASGHFIRRSDMYFALGDNRKYFDASDLYGIPTASLKGALCYYFASDDFYDAVDSVLKELGFERVEMIPQSLVQAYYLLPERKRDGYALFLDAGFLSSSVSVVYGNGIVHEESFDCGAGYILIALMQGLGVDYGTAEEILASANVSGGAVSKDLMWTDGSGEAYPVREIKEIVKCGLDDLCERVDNFFERYYRDKSTMNFASSPLSVTGEGIGGIGGAAEHIAKRLGRMTRVVYPDLPYYDKPVFSSRIALLSAALSERKKRGLFGRIFNIFGGKKNV